MKILNIYASLNGQTEKIAKEIEATCRDMDCPVTTVNVGRNGAEPDLLQSDLTFIGSGVYTWLPGKSMLKWIDRQLMTARDGGCIQPGSPRRPGRFACVYCTYAGPHTGEAEAVPAIKYMGQLFDHMGIGVEAEWSIPGAFVPPKMQAMNTTGRLGDITGRPNAGDLRMVRQRVAGLVQSLRPAVAARHKSV